MTDSPMVKALTLKRRIDLVLTTLEVEVWIHEKDVHVIAARLCAKTYTGFYLAGYTRWGHRYVWVSTTIKDNE